MLVILPLREAYKRNIPGRIIGVTKDMDNNLSFSNGIANKRATYKKRPSNLKHMYSTSFVSGLWLECMLFIMVQMD